MLLNPIMYKTSLIKFQHTRSNAFSKSNLQIRLGKLLLCRESIHSFATRIPSRIYLPLMKLVCWDDIKYEKVVLSLSSRTFGMIFYKLPIRLIGLKSFIFLTLSFLGRLKPLKDCHNVCFCNIPPIHITLHMEAIRFKGSILAQIFYCFKNFLLLDFAFTPSVCGLVHFH